MVVLNGSFVNFLLIFFSFKNIIDNLYLVFKSVKWYIYIYNKVLLKLIG